MSPGREGSRHKNAGSARQREREGRERGREREEVSIESWKTNLDMI